MGASKSNDQLRLSLPLHYTHIDLARVQLDATGCNWKRHSRWCIVIIHSCSLPFQRFARVILSHYHQESCSRWYTLLVLGSPSVNLKAFNSLLKVCELTSREGSKSTSQCFALRSYFPIIVSTAHPAQSMATCLKFSYVGWQSFPAKTRLWRLGNHRSQSKYISNYIIYNISYVYLYNCIYYTYIHIHVMCLH